MTEVVDDDYSRADHTNWPMGHVDPLLGERRLTLEPLIYSACKPVALGSRPQPHVELRQRIDEEEKEEKPDREKIIAQQKRIIQLKDLQQVKEEVSKIIHGEQMMQRERNARSTMTMSIMIQSLKMIDLFEEKCEYIDSLDSIVVKTTEMGVKLGEREGFKAGLEGENEVLRKEISKLQSSLHNTREATNNKVRQQGKMLDDMKTMKENYTSMYKIAEGAKMKMGVLKNAMSEAEKSMESSIGEMPSMEGC